MSLSVTLPSVAPSGKNGPNSQRTKGLRYIFPPLSPLRSCVYHRAPPRDQIHSSAVDPRCLTGGYCRRLHPSGQGKTGSRGTVVCAGLREHPWGRVWHRGGQARWPAPTRASAGFLLTPNISVCIIHNEYERKIANREPSIRPAGCGRRQGLSAVIIRAKQTQSAAFLTSK